MSWNKIDILCWESVDTFQSKRRRNIPKSAENCSKAEFAMKLLVMDLKQQKEVTTLRCLSGWNIWTFFFQSKATNVSAFPFKLSRYQHLHEREWMIHEGSELQIISDSLFTLIDVAVIY